MRYETKDFQIDVGTYGKVCITHKSDMIGGRHVLPTGEAMGFLAAMDRLRVMWHNDAEAFTTALDALCDATWK